MLRASRVTVSSLVAAAGLVTLLDGTPQRYVSAIVATGKTDRATPIVTGVVNLRVRAPSLVLGVHVEPSAPPDTPVHWSSPDGKNRFDGLGLTGDFGFAVIDTRVGNVVTVSPSVHGYGTAIIAADIGGVVKQRVTLLVRDVNGIGFGCYWFMPLQQSVRFVHGIAERSSLAEADVAILGPGRAEGTIPNYGCWGENFRADATAYRITFGIGGRVLRPGLPYAFVPSLPYDAVDEPHPVDVRTHDGEVIRLHLTPGAGTYFTGWYEAVDSTAMRTKATTLQSSPAYLSEQPGFRGSSSPSGAGRARPSEARFGAPDGLPSN